MLIGTPATILTCVGYNPYRRFRAKPFDYALVVAAVAVVVVLLIWAFAG
jgi:hypothetical protein